MTLSPPREPRFDAGRSLGSRLAAHLAELEAEQVSVLDLGPVYPALTSAPPALVPISPAPTSPAPAPRARSVATYASTVARYSFT